jgi:hypothetical protein
MLRLNLESHPFLRLLQQSPDQFLPFQLPLSTHHRLLQEVLRLLLWRLPLLPESIHTIRMQHPHHQLRYLPQARLDLHSTSYLSTTPHWTSGVVPRSVLRPSNFLESLQCSQCLATVIVLA